MSVEERERQIPPPFDQIELNWAGQEAIFLKLLRLKDIKLAIDLLNAEFDEPTLGELDIGSIEWWLPSLSYTPDHF
jgi:hypothetical protein